MQKNWILPVSQHENGDLLQVIVGDVYVLHLVIHSVKIKCAIQETIEVIFATGTIDVIIRISLVIRKTVCLVEQVFEKLSTSNTQ